MIQRTYQLSGFAAGVWLSLIIVAGPLCACSIHGSGVVSHGENHYALTRQSGAVWISVDTLKAEAMQEANAYCAKKQQKLNLIRSKETPAGFGRWAESEVVFTCE